MAISPQRLTIYLYSAHRAVIFAIAQLSCIITNHVSRKHEREEKQAKEDLDWKKHDKIVRIPKTTKIFRQADRQRDSIGIAISHSLYM